MLATFVICPLTVVRVMGTHLGGTLTKRLKAVKNSVGEAVEATKTTFSTRRNAMKRATCATFLLILEIVGVPYKDGISMRIVGSVNYLVGVVVVAMAIIL
mmetsp:Transcript_21692/g.33117  ORF Transcript_21692/g.33117 Transcript_21692/m.33117 type:complete len:100 (+) Transcript_21692:1290-1589(+)